MILLYHKHRLFARHFEESCRDVDRRPLGQVKCIWVIVEILDLEKVLRKNFKPLEKISGFGARL